MSRIEEHLMKELDRFTAFARSRVGDAHLAADVVQESLLKALKSADQLRDEESLTAWFYRILRRTIIDLHRRREAARRVEERWEAEGDTARDAETERVACACVASLIDTLKPEYAELIRELDLEGKTAKEVAAVRGLTPNNLRVRHHRARQQLRERIEATCRVCAKHGCLNCTCQTA
jgi:RNA polymerase sigma factor (sigma-70 family)